MLRAGTGAKASPSSSHRGPDEDRTTGGVYPMGWSVGWFGKPCWNWVFCASTSSKCLGLLHNQSKDFIKEFIKEFIHVHPCSSKSQVRKIKVYGHGLLMFFEVKTDFFFQSITGAFLGPMATCAQQKLHCRWKYRHIPPFVRRPNGLQWVLACLQGHQGFVN